MNLWTRWRRRRNHRRAYDAQEDKRLTEHLSALRPTGDEPRKPPCVPHKTEEAAMTAYLNLGGYVVSEPGPEWMDRSLCRDDPDPDLWFPSGRDATSVAIDEAEAKSVCRRCPVRTDCLAWALENGQGEGIWGGFTAKERKNMKRRMANSKTEVDQ